MGREKKGYPGLHRPSMTNRGGGSNKRWGRNGRELAFFVVWRLMLSYLINDFPLSNRQILTLNDETEMLLLAVLEAFCLNNSFGSVQCLKFLLL